MPPKRKQQRGRRLKAANARPKRASARPRRRRGGGAPKAQSLTRTLGNPRAVRSRYSFVSHSDRGLAIDVCLPVMRVRAAETRLTTELAFNVRGIDWGPVAAIAEAFQEWRPEGGTFHYVPVMAFTQEVTVAAAWMDDPLGSAPEGVLALAQMRGGEIGGGYLSLSTVKGPSRATDWLYCRPQSAQSRLDTAGKLVVITQSNTPDLDIETGFMYWSGRLHFRDIRPLAPTAFNITMKFPTGVPANDGATATAHKILEDVGRAANPANTVFKAGPIDTERLMRVAKAGMASSFAGIQVSAAAAYAAADERERRPTLRSSRARDRCYTYVDGVLWNTSRHAHLLGGLVVFGARDTWRPATVADAEGGDVVAYGPLLTANEVGVRVQVFDPAGFIANIHAETRDVTTVPSLEPFVSGYNNWDEVSHPGVEFLGYAVLTGSARVVDEVGTLVEMAYVAATEGVFVEPVTAASTRPDPRFRPLPRCREAAVEEDEERKL